MVLKMLHDRECAVKQAEARACALLQEAQLQYAAATPRAGRDSDAARRLLDLRGYSPGSVKETWQGEKRGKKASELAREVEHHGVKLKTLEHENTVCSMFTACLHVHYLSVLTS